MGPHLPPQLLQAGRQHPPGPPPAVVAHPKWPRGGGRGGPGLAGHRPDRGRGERKATPSRWPPPAGRRHQRGGSRWHGASPPKWRRPLIMAAATPKMAPPTQPHSPRPRWRRPLRLQSKMAPPMPPPPPLPPGRSPRSPQHLHGRGGPGGSRGGFGGPRGGPWGFPGASGPRAAGGAASGGLRGRLRGLGAGRSLRAGLAANQRRACK